MDIHRHAAPVVTDFNEAIFLQDDIDSIAVSCNRFIDTVIHDFLYEVIRSRGVGVHARTLAHGLEPGQDFDIGRVVS